MKKTFFSIFIIVLIFSGVYLLSTNKYNSKDIEYNDKTKQFIHENPSKTIDLLEKKTPGIYYFGFPTCSWCKEILPIFDSVLKKYNFKSYVVNTRSSDFTNEDNEKLKNFFVENTALDKLTVPFIVNINENGNIKTHVGTIENHNAKVESLTNKEKKELTTIIEELIKN